MPRNKERTLDAYIGARVRMRRLMLNMSQEALSGKLGVTFQQVQKYEKGLNRISASRLFELSQALGVPVGYFYDGLDEGDALVRLNGADGLQDSPAVSPLMEFISSGPGVELNQAFLRIEDDKMRRRLLAMVNDIARVTGEPKARGRKIWS
jgi:transcriptional regulator with XRE-family HTH domain